MTPDEITKARRELGLTLSEMAQMLGYDGKQRRAQMHDMESGARAFRPAQRRLMEAYLSGYRPDDWPVA